MSVQILLGLCFKGFSVIFGVAWWPSRVLYCRIKITINIFFVKLSGARS